MHVVRGDLGDPEAVERAVQGVELVYHVGAGMRGGTEAFESGTVWGTKNVVAACLRHGIKRLVYVSSLSVLDHAGHPKGVPITESSPVEPHPELRGAYSQTKLIAENLVLDAIRNRNCRRLSFARDRSSARCRRRRPPSGVIGSGRPLAGDGFGPIASESRLCRGCGGCAPAGGNRSRMCPASVFQLVDPATLTQREYIEAAKTYGSAPRVSYVPKLCSTHLRWAWNFSGECFGRRRRLSRAIRSGRSLPFRRSTAPRRATSWAGRRR